MLTTENKNQIILIWERYITDNKKIFDTKGNDLDNIDDRRIAVINDIRILIYDFLKGTKDIIEFKTEIDSINKQNNLWGFTAIKGQMFFNLLLKTGDIDNHYTKLTRLLTECISEPSDLPDALKKNELLDKYTTDIFNKAPDKRKAPNPGSVCYFLSYFWQIHNYQKWPIMYSSIVMSLSEIGLWEQPKSSREAYNNFYLLNEEIKNAISSHTGKQISNWEAEHAFWNLRKVSTSSKSAKNKEIILVNDQSDSVTAALIEATFNIFEYIPPVTAGLIDLGRLTNTSAPTKGGKYERAVCEVFKQLGFMVQHLGQGTGREPDLIAIHKEENVAFIVDAKAYSNGYILSTGDERAIREYINHYCPKLKKEGINRIGFIIVSNSFKSGFEGFINEVTWKTEIKRFTLLSSDALLHLLAYKIKDQLLLIDIIEAIISLGAQIEAKDIIQKFDDI